MAKGKTNGKYSMLGVVLKHAHANVELHKMNIRCYLDNPAGIGEHSDIMEAIQSEFDKMAVHQDRYDLVEKMMQEEQELDVL